jgi:hypothetical protein
MKKTNISFFLFFLILTAFFLLNCEDFVLLSKDQFNGRFNNSNSNGILTTSNYNSVTGQDIANNIANITQTGMFLHTPFNAGLVMYGITTEGNFVKLKFLNAVNDSSVDGLNIAFTVYNSSNNIISSSAGTLISNTFVFDFETSVQDGGSATDDFWYDINSGPTDFYFVSYNSAKYFIAP